MHIIARLWSIHRNVFLVWSMCCTSTNGGLCSYMIHATPCKLGWIAISAVRGQIEEDLHEIRECVSVCVAQCAMGFQIPVNRMILRVHFCRCLPTDST